MIFFPMKPPETLPSFAWQEAKAKRKQILAAVRHRRRLIYHRPQAEPETTSKQPFF
jgi:hypothetical protein